MCPHLIPAFYTKTPGIPECLPHTMLFWTSLLILTWTHHLSISFSLLHLASSSSPSWLSLFLTFSKKQILIPRRDHLCSHITCAHFSPSPCQSLVISSSAVCPPLILQFRVIKFDQASESPATPCKKVVIKYIWCKAQELAFLTRSQVMLMLVARGEHTVIQ